MSDVLSAEEALGELKRLLATPEYGLDADCLPGDAADWVFKHGPAVLAAARAGGCAADLAETLRRITTMPFLMSSVEAARIARDALAAFDRAVSGQTAEKEEA